MRSLLPLVGVMLALAGCTSMDIPNNQTNFPGLSQLTNGPAPLRIFMIHGIGDHTATWGEGYLNPLAQELGKGWAVKPGAYIPVQWSADPSNTFVGHVQIYTLTQNSQTRAIVYQLYWGELTEPFKEQRFKADLAQWRPVLNGIFREVVDNNLSDVVLYLSNFDNGVLNKTAEQALSAFYSGRWDPDPQTKKALHESPTVVITESLGSLMFFNAVIDLTVQKQGTDEEQHLKAFLKNNQLIFMMANQINLLEMPLPEPSGQVPPPAGTVGPSVAAYSSAVLSPTTVAATEPSEGKPVAASMRTFLRLRFQAKHPGETTLRKTGERPFLFVAFNDPNDVLSYTVTNDDLKQYAQYEQAAIDNFYPRNAFDWFWIYESISDAHTGYKDNTHVTGLMVKGYSKGKDQP